MKRRRKGAPITQESLAALRKQLGTKELAKRMGIPAPSLRRLLSKGKSGGVPKFKSRGYAKFAKKVRAARIAPDKAVRQKALEKARKAYALGELDSLYNEIADEMGLEAREVYWMGVSPGHFGEVA